MKCIYVAGPLNAPACSYIENVHAMIQQADRIRRLGYAVLVPCQDILTGLVMGNLTYQDYFENNLAWLEKADAVFLCKGWEGSEGCKREAARARELGIPIYTNIMELVGRGK